MDFGYGWVGDINNPSTWQYETLQFKDWFNDNGHGLIFTTKIFIQLFGIVLEVHKETVSGNIGGRISMVTVMDITIPI